jgi:hypothetical protein
MRGSGKRRDTNLPTSAYCRRKRRAWSDGMATRRISSREASTMMGSTMKGDAMIMSKCCHQR